MPAGFDVEFAIDAREASRVLERRPPSLVVVDMQTGNAGGYALMRYVAEARHLPHIPVLVLLERAQDAWLARIAGAAASRVKPLAPGELERAVAELTSEG